MKDIELKTGFKIRSKQKYLQNEIRRKILSGEYSEKLPGLRELAEQYNANIITIRKALEPLKKKVFFQ